MVRKDGEAATGSAQHLRAPNPHQTKQPQKEEGTPLRRLLPLPRLPSQPGSASDLHPSAVRRVGGEVDGFATQGDDQHPTPRPDKPLPQGQKRAPATAEDPPAQPPSRPGSSRTWVQQRSGRTERPQRAVSSVPGPPSHGRCARPNRKKTPPSGNFSTSPDPRLNRGLRVTCVPQQSGESGAKSADPTPKGRPPQQSRHSPTLSDQRRRGKEGGKSEHTADSSTCPLRGSRATCVNQRSGGRGRRTAVNPSTRDQQTHATPPHTSLTGPAADRLPLSARRYLSCARMISREGGIMALPLTVL